MARSSLAAIEYHGIAGSSHDCERAVLRLLHFPPGIEKARIVTCDNSHCLFLTNPYGDQIAVKSGFSSGYGGTGPSSFSFVLGCLEAQGIEVDELVVDQSVLDRLDGSTLRLSDLKLIEESPGSLAWRRKDYLGEVHMLAVHDGSIWKWADLVVPYALLDNRLAKLTRSFWDDPAGKLMKGYVLLEDVVRKRTALNEHGAKLFNTAFLSAEAALTWRVTDKGEIAGRTSLFTGIYGAYRNARAHRGVGDSTEECLSELLLLNHLFRLENEAVPADRPIAKT